MTMNVSTLAKELATEAERMEAQAKALREAVAALSPVTVRRGRPRGSKNRPKVTA